MATPVAVTEGSIDILGQKWTVKLLPIPGGEFGVTYSAKAEIHINSDHDPATYADTLLHEITHAIELMLRLDMKEGQVSRLATGFRSFFKSNPKLAAWLIQ